MNVNALAAVPAPVATARSGSTEPRPGNERTPARADAPTAPATVAEETIQSAIERAGRDVALDGRSIQFNFDRDIGRVIVRVVAKDSGEVVRQIPPEEFLKFAAQFRELAGILFDDKV